MKATIRAIAILALALASGLALATPPGTLGYTGRLADSGGNPITADLSITFRLYDVQSGGAALWTEVQPSVPVDGGNLAVQLGSVTALPPSIWGKQLYLGIQVAGDTEMAPRPPLTASPYALRAARTMKNTVVVSAEGTPTENGTALIAAVATTAGATGTQPITVEIDAGTYDLGSTMLSVPSYVSLVGRGEDVSVLTSSNPSGTVVFASNTQARRFTARSTGVPPSDQDITFGIAAATVALDQTTVNNVIFDGVTGESVGAGALGGRWGIYFCAANSRLANSIGRAQNGDFTIALRADCQTAAGMFIENVTLYASDGAGGVRGAFLSGGGAWSNIKAIVQQTLTSGSAGSYGIRVVPNSIDAAAVLLNAAVSIVGTNPAGTTTIAAIEGFRVDTGADVDVKGLFVSIDGVKALSVSGVRLLADSTSSHNVHISDADIRVAGVQDAAQGGGVIVGIRAQGAAPEIARTKVKVDCLPGGYNLCAGFAQTSNPNNGTMQSGTVALDQVTIEVGHDGPADSSAQSVAYQGQTAARIDHSTLRVLRSAADELQSGVNTSGPGAAYRIHDSSIEIQSANANPATSNCVLANGGNGNIELFGGYVEGQSCISQGQNAPVCAGVLKRGVGLLVSTCP